MTYHEILGRSQLVPSRMVCAATSREDPLADESPGDLKDMIRELQNKDTMVQEKIHAILEDVTRAKHWSLDVERLLYYKGRLYVPVAGNLRRRLIEIHHDEPLAGHFGRTRTEELVKRKFHWEYLPRDI